VLACSIAIQIRQSSSRNLVGSNEDGVSDDDETNDFDACNTALYMPSFMSGQDNRIVRNRFGTLAGNGVAMDLQGGLRTVVRNNLVASSDATGIRIGDATTLGDGSAGNCLAGNATGLRHEGSASIVFEGNWWGAADGPGGDGPGSGDAIEVTGIGSLDFEPFRSDGCVFVPEPGGAGAAVAAALALAASAARRRRCVASSSA